MTRTNQILGYVFLFPGQYSVAELAAETGFPLGTVSCVVSRACASGQVTVYDSRLWSDWYSLSDRPGFVDMLRESYRLLGQA